MVEGKRRFLAFLAVVIGIIAVEIVNTYDGGGLSAFGQGGLLGACATYFGSVAVDKFKNGGKDNVKDAS